MNKQIKINSLVSAEIEQIKIVGKLTIGGKELSGYLNKTLDVSILSQLPVDVIQGLTTFAFGEDYNSEEISNIVSSLSETLSSE